MTTRGSMLLVSSFVACAIAASPSVAHADLEPPKQTSFTMSPLLVVTGVVELAAEWRVARHWDLGTLGSIGRIRLDNGGRATMYELGAQASLYLRPDNRGWHLGAVARWADSSVDIEDALFIDETNAGLSVGYKWISSIGATVLIDTGGAVFVDGRDQLRAGPLIRAEVGWSF